MKRPYIRWRDAIKNAREPENYAVSAWEDDHGIYIGLEDYIEQWLDMRSSGQPWYMLMYLRDVLEHVDRWRDEDFPTWDARADELCGGRGGRVFMWAWIEQQRLTDAGGNTQAAWLIESGENLLADLNDLRKIYDELGMENFSFDYQVQYDVSKALLDN